MLFKEGIPSSASPTQQTMNMNSLRDSLPISVESTPRHSTTAGHLEDTRMPDLVSDGGGGSGSLTPRTNQDWDEDEDPVQVTDGAMGDNESRLSASEAANVVDSFNEVYKNQLKYYDEAYEPVEALRVSSREDFWRWDQECAEYC